MMSRTEKRPLPRGSMSLAEAYSVVVLSLGLGSWMLYQLNLNAMILGLIAYVSYAFIYTPLKQVTPWAVIVGAFPGAIPPMLRSEEHTSELQSRPHLVCRLLLEKKKNNSI